MSSYKKNKIQIKLVQFHLEYINSVYHSLIIARYFNAKVYPMLKIMRQLLLELFFEIWKGIIIKPIL